MARYAVLTYDFKIFKLFRRRLASEVKESQRKIICEIDLGPRYNYSAFSLNPSKA